MSFISISSESNNYKEFSLEKKEQEILDRLKHFQSQFFDPASNFKEINRMASTHLKKITEGRSIEKVSLFCEEWVGLSAIALSMQATSYLNAWEGKQNKNDLLQQTGICVGLNFQFLKDASSLPLDEDQALIRNSLFFTPLTSDEKTFGEKTAKARFFQSLHQSHKKIDVLDKNGTLDESFTYLKKAHLKECGLQFEKSKDVSSTEVRKVLEELDEDEVCTIEFKVGEDLENLIEERHLVSYTGNQFFDPKNLVATGDRDELLTYVCCHLTHSYPQVETLTLKIFRRI